MNLGELRPGYMLVWAEADNLSSSNFSDTKVRFVVASTRRGADVIITWLFRNGTLYQEVGNPTWPVYHQWKVIGRNDAHR